MFNDRKATHKPLAPALSPESGKSASITLLTVVGEHARMEGKFDITDSIQIECEVGGELNVGGKLVIGEKGVVSANVQTVDAIIMGQYEGNMVATGNVEIAETGRVTGNITKINEAGARQVVAIDEKRGDQQKQQFASR